MPRQRLHLSQSDLLISLPTSRLSINFPSDAPAEASWMVLDGMIKRPLNVTSGSPSDVPDLIK